MSERITRANLDERAANVNRRLEGTGRMIRVQGRNGYIGLDEYRMVEHDLMGMETWEAVRMLTCGTKREIGDYLTAMMVGIDLVRS